MAGWPERGCGGCSFLADQVAHLAHLNARDTTLAFVSRAPQPDIERWKARMGWAQIPWYTLTDAFDADFDVDEWHGTNAFLRDRDQIFRTYFVNQRGDEAMGSTWSYLDLTALGRQERWEDSPEDYHKPRLTGGGTCTTSTTSPRDRSAAELPDHHREIAPFRSRTRTSPDPKQRNCPMLQPRVLTTGHAFGESPRWHNDGLWFSDWGAQEILAVDLEGHVETVVRVDFPSFPMCIDFLPNGRLLIVSGRDGRLLRRESDASLVTHADLSTLSRHPWNDLVVDGRGSTFINEAGFTFPAGEFAPGTIAQVTPDGSSRQVADGLAFPNGMAIAPDNSTLIVAESYAKQLTAFDIAPDGSLSGRRVWADLGDGVPDGICLDAEGAVWYSDVPNKRCVRVREGGEVLETVELDRGCFACALGGRDGSTLFMVAQEWGGPENMRSAARTGQLLITRTTAPRAGWP